MANKIYCAGPLFNEGETHTMQKVAEAFEKRGYSTFLPQRDGIEFCDLASRVYKMDVFGTWDEAVQIAKRAVTAIDEYEIRDDCKGFVGCLDGIMIDDGTSSEARYAWCLDKPMVGFKTDIRNPFDGIANPLVVDLFGDNLCDNIEDAADLMCEIMPPNDEPDISSHISFKTRMAYLGDAISQLKSRGADLDAIASETAMTMLKDENEFEQNR